METGGVRFEGTRSSEVSFIEKERGLNINVFSMRRVSMDAQSLQYLKAAVTKSIQSHLGGNTIFTAFQAM